MVDDMPCVFCGAKKTTREHVWPLWVREAVKDSPRSLFHLRRGETIPEHSFQAPAFDLVVKRVCASCNNGWMSTLEGRAQGMLTPLLQERGRELHRDGQGVLAAWAMKTATMLEYSHPRALAIGQEDRTWLFEKGEAPPRTQVWIGVYSGEQLNTWYMSDRFDALGEAVGTGATPYGITFLMGRVVFQLWGRGDSERVLQTKGPLRKRLQQIHPYQRSLTVTPASALDDRLLKDAALSLRQPGKRNMIGWKFGVQRGA